MGPVQGSVNMRGTTTPPHPIPEELTGWLDQKDKSTQCTYIYIDYDLNYLSIKITSNFDHI